MNDLVRTGVIAAAAVAIAGITVLTRPAPPEATALAEQGEAFYPGFTDPAAAASLEVFSWQEDAGIVRAFKVHRTEDGWTIPSHHDYPADGEERLARTAASVMDLRKDVIRSDRARDHEAFGVIDPLDEASVALSGRGDRITLRDADGAVLADYVIGDPVPDRPGFRYVRVPGRPRTYAVRADVDVSVRFRDWIDDTLLETSPEDLRLVELQDYAVDESSGAVSFEGSATLARADADADWTIEPASPDTEVDADRVSSMLEALAGLRITGVRPKPPGLAAGLRADAGLELGVEEQLSLQDRGFFVSADGRLLSNEGEIRVGAADGVVATLRFGEVLEGDGLAVSAGDDPAGPGDDAADSASAVTGEGDRSLHRYVFITAGFDASLLGPRPEPAAGADAPAAAAADPEAADAEASGEADGEADGEASGDAADEDGTPVDPAVLAWERRAEEGRGRAAELNARFADWYYVISAEDFDAMRPSLGELVRPAGEEETPAADAAAPGAGAGGTDGVPLLLAPPAAADEADAGAEAAAGGAAG